MAQKEHAYALARFYKIKFIGSRKTWRAKFQADVKEEGGRGSDLNVQWTLQLCSSSRKVVSDWFATLSGFGAIRPISVLVLSFAIRFHGYRAWPLGLDHECENSRAVVEQTVDLCEGVYKELRRFLYISDTL